MQRIVLSAIAIAFLLTVGMQAEAQYVRQQLIPIPSVAPSSAEILTGKPGTAITVTGHLRLPKGEKLPAVILMHAGGGYGGDEGAMVGWSQVLNEAGIASFVIDSFTPRGSVNPPADAGKVAPLERLPDAFAALSVLAKSPHIDPKRIAVMGFSHGSTAALLSNVARFQKLYGSADLQFAAHVVVYGFCITNLRGDDDLTKPVLVLHGTADDVLPIEPCREYVARVSKAGKSIRLIEYADAHHGFDELWTKVAVKRPQAPNVSKCRLVEGDGGVLLSKETNQPFTPNDQCVGKGMTLHYHEAATKKVYEDVKAFLKEIFKQ